MKIIFLDIDGVLNYVGCMNVLPGDVCFVEDEKLKLLKQIVDATGAYIVLASSWRYGWREADQGRETSIVARNYYQLLNKFHEYELGFLSKTPVLQNFNREMEIRYWLSTWENDIVESFVVIDDDEYEFVELREQLVQTNRNIGLQEKDVKKAIEILKMN